MRHKLLIIIKRNAMNRLLLPPILLFLAAPFAALHAQTPLSDSARLCLMEKLAQAGDDVTLGQLRTECAQQPMESPLVERAKLEQLTYADRYAIAPHKQNYFLFVSQNANTPKSPDYQKSGSSRSEAARTEADFQVSVKFPVIPGGEQDTKWMVAYTNRSFWQAYNKEWSQPFRETNHEPETWLQLPLRQPVPGTAFTLRYATLGLDHQSNGQSGEWSRSWNRVTASLAADSENFSLALRPWWKMPDRSSKNDNPDISHYLGYFDLTASWRLPGRHRVSLLLRNNLEREHNRGGYELSYGAPIPGTNHLRLFVLGFTGYGKSLISYDQRQSSLGMGLELVDW